MTTGNGSHKRQINTSPLDNITVAMLGDGEFHDLPDDTLRVERILLELVRPDPVQPRRVLPERVYHAFHNQRLTPSQALRELIHSAQLAARQQGRPFTSVVELLGETEDESDREPAALTPEEQLVRDLVNLAVTIRDDGQVNPLTVVDVSEGVTHLYRIETGERRYWATWLLRDFLPDYRGDGLIPCIIIPPGVASAFRQAKENTARSGLSAIAMARQIALLLLQVHGYEITGGAVTNDFYRQALDLDLRSKRDFTGDILAALGGINRKQLSRFKSLLRLSDEAFELADRHNLDEFVLRQVLSMPVDEQAEMIRHIIHLGLTAKQVQEMCQPSQEETTTRTDFPKHTKQLVRLMKSVGASTGKDVAQALLDEDHDVEIARARLSGLRRLIDEAETYLSE